MDRGVFLVGGYDLEMQTIVALLKEQGCLYKDNSLLWHNAHLSQYTKELQEYGTNPDCLIYGIELQEDVLPPPNYVRIDHHNDYVSRSSALEQVAAIIGIELSRYQCLVAANDKGYIPGMEMLGATPEEISQIRREDRKAQGVTEEDERLAEIAVGEHKKQAGGLLVVKAFSTKFSPICDRLYPHTKLLVHTEEELVYYGEGVKRVAAYLGSVLAKNQYYYGGGENGYCGTVRNALSWRELQIIIEKIMQYECGI